MPFLPILPRAHCRRARNFFNSGANTLQKKKNANGQRKHGATPEPLAAFMPAAESAGKEEIEKNLETASYCLRTRKNCSERARTEMFLMARFKIVTDK